MNHRKLVVPVLCILLALTAACNGDGNGAHPKADAATRSGPSEAEDAQPKPASEQPQKAASSSLDDYQMTAAVCDTIKSRFQQFLGTSEPVTSTVQLARDTPGIPTSSDAAGGCILTNGDSSGNGDAHTLQVMFAVGGEDYFPADFDTMVKAIGFGDFEAWRQIEPTPSGGDLGTYRIHSDIGTPDTDMEFLVDSSAQISCLHDNDYVNHDLVGKENAQNFDGIVAMCDAARTAMRK